jgi:glyoxylase-like metal-dependent hydrolase (beta-lactamase superfamily II)
VLFPERDDGFAKRGGVNQTLSPTGPLRLEALALGPFETNAWLLAPPEGPATVVDPGMEPEPLLERLEELGLRVGRVLLTHGHLDHVAGCAELARRFACPVHLHPEDLFLYRSLAQHGALYGFSLEAAPEPVLPLRDGQRLPLGAGELEVLATPGHSPGGVCFRFETIEGPCLLCGDTIFAGNVGRTDLPGGSLARLSESILGRVLRLAPATRLLPGHGPESTVALEARDNPIHGLQWER